MDPNPLSAENPRRSAVSLPGPTDSPQSIRDRFPRLNTLRYLNAAGGTPLADFSRDGIERWMGWWEHGPGTPQAAYFTEVFNGVRGRFAGLVGADADEIAMVNSTKAGEQAVIDGLGILGSDRNLVTNDLHFSGSLHNLVGMRDQGTDVRIVRAQDWSVSADQMAEQIDHQTGLVCITMISNVNGHVEDVRGITELAHSRGALVYLDLIQAAGIYPVDLHDLGVDFAAANGYKWLYGTYGAAYLYVRKDLQGTVFPDRAFPGSVRHNYEPWVDAPDPAAADFVTSFRDDATRYQPGHQAYIAHAGTYEGMGFIESVGLDRMHRHSVGLCRRLRDALDLDQIPCISPEGGDGPIVSFDVADARRLEEPLVEAGLVITLNQHSIRVSPAIYNTPEDIDVLAEVLTRNV